MTGERWTFYFEGKFNREAGAYDGYGQNSGKQLSKYL